ncbi:MAG: hypothetical protein COT71_02910 [Candidatus Andersenbacteria bacterium CG10_big_fil_rev_8_21_14_0_10_54_11]|uniref:Uncharacterized protein n=1 Tax=Candidatus Andersenbacteria bacterium CG10_big_fil_rev_8_21_14_0_10_54_11 TaxID=1974485 RepID=A0A2M6WZ35_9BACT|nr:MAG: hypothetical protein COT71_02910 [Candidatus Andersenbacteria bacterium CG10_big_fil_rev_8_21_14_0_10_54_11]
MSQLVRMAIVICIILFGLGLVVSPAKGKKLDSFILLRPVGHLILPLPGKLTRVLSSIQYDCAKNLWHAAPNQPILVRIPMYSLAAALAISGWLFSIVAAICSECFGR